MNAGEAKGLQFFVNAQPPAMPPANPVTLVGAVVTLKIQTPLGVTSTVSCTTVTTDPNPINQYATYQTQTTDFATAGTYILQLIATYGGSSTILKSVETPFPVGPSL